MNPRIFRRASHVIGAIAAATVAGAAIAQSNPLDLKDMMQEADLVFHGEVVQIDYAMSLPSEMDGTRIPYTFVTYHVEDVLYGRNPGRFLTLRFVGGVDYESETYMSTSLSPEFDLGDKDMLFVKDNAVSEIPLVRNFHSRLRLIDDQVYSEMGNAISFQNGVIVHGSQYWLEEVFLSDNGIGVFMIDLGPDALQLPSNAMTAKDAIDELADIAATLVRKRERIVQADPTVPFEAPAVLPEPPPDDPASAEGDAHDDDMTPEERRELERLEKQSKKSNRKRG